MRPGSFVLICAAIAAGSGAGHAEDADRAPAADLGDLCAGYGPGFKAVGQTDICLRISGSVAAETGFVAGGDDNGGIGSRADKDSWRNQAEGKAAIETQFETDFGTVRTMFEIESGGLDRR